MIRVFENIRFKKKYKKYKNLSFGLKKKYCPLSYKVPKNIRLLLKIWSYCQNRTDNVHIKKQLNCCTATKKSFWVGGISYRTVEDQTVRVFWLPGYASLLSVIECLFRSQQVPKLLSDLRHFQRYSTEKWA